MKTFSSEISYAQNSVLGVPQQPYEVFIAAGSPINGQPQKKKPDDLEPWWQADNHLAQLRRSKCFIVSLSYQWRKDVNG